MQNKMKSSAKNFVMRFAIRNISSPAIISEYRLSANMPLRGADCALCAVKWSGEYQDGTINVMGPIGFQELILILIIALVVFGPKKLPELGRSLGKTLAEFRRASNEIKQSIEKELQDTDEQNKISH